MNRKMYERDMKDTVRMPEYISRQAKEKCTELMDKFLDEFLELTTRMIPYALETQHVSAI